MTRQGCEGRVRSPATSSGRDRRRRVPSRSRTHRARPRPRAVRTHLSAQLGRAGDCLQQLGADGVGDIGSLPGGARDVPAVHHDLDEGHLPDGGGRLVTAAARSRVPFQAAGSSQAAAVASSRSASRLGQSPCGVVGPAAPRVVRVERLLPGQPRQCGRRAERVVHQRLQVEVCARRRAGQIRARRCRAVPLRSRRRRRSLPVVCSSG